MLRKEIDVADESIRPDHRLELERITDIARFPRGRHRYAFGGRGWIEFRGVADFVDRFDDRALATLRGEPFENLQARLAGLGQLQHAPVTGATAALRVEEGGG